MSKLVLRRNTALFVVSIGLIVIAISLLWVTADPSQSTASTRRLFGFWRARYVLLALAAVVVAVACLTAAHSRTGLLAYGTVVLVTLLTLMVLELAGQIGVVSWSRTFSRHGDLGSLGTRRTPNLDMRGVTYQDTAVAWGLPLEAIPFHYRTDRHGLRNEPDRARADLYLLGDSMLVAALVPFAETVTARLERLLNRPVMKVALINLGPQGEHELFRAAALDVRGSRVVQFIFEGNDLLDSKGFGERSAVRDGSSATPDWLLSHVWELLTRLSDPAANTARSGVARTRSCALGGTNYTFAWARNSFAGVETEAEVISAALERFSTEIRKLGGEYAVVFVPKKLRVIGGSCHFSQGSELTDVNHHLGPLQEHLRMWSERTGIPFFDLTEPLKQATAGGRIPWFPFDTHWNAAGHDAAATALAQWEFLR